MPNPNILISGNVLYIKIDSENVKIDKYLLCGISGYIMGLDIYTYEEIMEESPNARPCKDFLEVNKVYHDRS